MIVILVPLNVTCDVSVTDIVLVSPAPFEMTIFPVFATIFSSKVSTILELAEIPVASSAGVELFSVGLVESEVAPVSKFNVVASLIPA